MAEAEGVVAGQLRACRAGRAPCARARRAAPSTCAVVGRERLRPRRGGRRWPSTEPRSSTSRSAGSSWSSRAASSAWIVGGTATSPPPDSRHERDHLLDEERVALGRLEDPLAQLVVDAVAERARSARPSRPARAARAGRSSRSACRRPSAGRRVEQLRPGHAEQQDRRVARQVGDVLDQVEERRLAPVDVVEDDDERAARRPRASSSLRKAQAISSRRAAAGVVAEQRARAARPRSARLAPRELLHDLDDRPVGDALAVGEAAAADDRARRAPPRNSCASRDLPTPAAPRTVNSWHERSLTTPGRTRPRAARSSVSRPTIGASWRRPARLGLHRRAAGRRRPARPCPSASSGSTGLGLDRRPGRAA